jgi:hypothetical protein
LRDHTLHLAYDSGPELRIAFPGIEDPEQSGYDLSKDGKSL